MVDLSKFNATQLLLFVAIADFDCCNINCEICPFNLNNGCGSMKMRELLESGQK